MRNNQRKFYCTILLLALTMTTFGQPQTANTSFRLSVTGIAEKSLQLTLADFAKLPRRTVSAKNHDGKECAYEGVELHEIMARVGVTFGKELRGNLLASAVLIEAADNYKTVFALPELDPMFAAKIILLADKCDGQPIEKNGPLQMIVPDEKRHARWVQQVKTISLVFVTAKK